MVFKFLKKPKSESSTTTGSWRGAPPPRPMGSGLSSPGKHQPFLQMYGAEGDQETVLARELLDGRGIRYSYINVTDDDTTRRWLRKKTGVATLPQLFIDESPIGDYGILREIEYRGDLDRLLSGEIRPDALKMERADEDKDLSGRDAPTIKERLRRGEILGLTLPDGGTFDTWAEVFANPPQVYYEGAPYPVSELDRVVDEIAAHIARGATYTWREDD